MSSMLKRVQQLTYLECGLGYNYNRDVHSKLDRNVRDIERSLSEPSYERNTANVLWNYGCMCLVCGSESCTCTKKVESRLQAVKMRLLNAFKRRALHDHMRNEITGIQQGLNIFFVLDEIRYNRKLPTQLQEDIPGGRSPFPPHVKKRTIQNM